MFKGLPIKHGELQLETTRSNKAMFRTHENKVQSKQKEPNTHYKISILEHGCREILF